ncbi:unnamed protein product [Arabis nemorensis]|uniref:CCHC-type domain-containing protein n=1 Tax=Arabis nemorensis TaxID=586526 RepID=A0A565CP48_9BRAS|nr:unnamed protein product [Arabis nemorensis]
MGLGRGKGDKDGHYIPSQDSPIICYRCGEHGHISRTCPNARQFGVKPVYVTCLSCGEQGHYVASCTQSYQPAQPTIPRDRNEPLSIEPPPKRQATTGRVYLLDSNKPEPSRPSKGPNSGKYAR